MGKLTAPAVRARKVRDGAAPLVMVTAYDAPGARIADEAGVDLVLVGDSVAMVVLGYEDTLQVTVADIAHHTAAVARTRPSEVSTSTSDRQTSRNQPPSGCRSSPRASTSGETAGACPGVLTPRRLP